MDAGIRATRPAPRQAVILAAGLGSRLRPFTDCMPKPLIPVNGVPILHNALRALAAIEVQDVTIVVGYRKEAIQRSCGHRFAGVDITYAESMSFHRTGSAYSLLLARDALLRGDLILLEGDVLFDLEALERLVCHEAEDAAAVAPFDETMSGSAVTVTTDGWIAEVRTGQTGAQGTGAGLYKTMNLIRLSSRTLKDVLVPQLESYPWERMRAAYVEQVLGDLIERRLMRVAAVRCDDLRWYEVDTAVDLHRAEHIFAADRIASNGVISPFRPVPHR